MTTMNLSLVYFKEASEDVQKEMAKRFNVHELYKTGTTDDSTVNWEAFGFVLVLVLSVGLFVCVCAGLCALARRFLLGNAQTQYYNVERAEARNDDSEKSTSRESLAPSGKGSQADAETLDNGSANKAGNNNTSKIVANIAESLKIPAPVVSASSRSLAPSGKGSEADADTNVAANQVANNAVQIAANTAVANAAQDPEVDPVEPVAVNFPAPVADNAQVIIDFSHGYENPIAWFHLEPEDDYQGPDPDAAYYHREAWRLV